MRPIDSLGLDRGVPPRIVEHHVTGCSEIQTSAGSTQAEQEHGWVRILLEGADDFLAVLGLAGKDVGADLTLGAFSLEQLEHLDELAEDEHLLSLRDQ